MDILVNIDKIQDYKVQEQIAETERTLIFRAFDENDVSVVLKVLKDEAVTEENVARIKKEFKLTSSLNCAGIVKARDIFPFRMGQVLVSEDFHGISLRKYMTDEMFPLSNEKILHILELAIQITEALAEIHNKNVIHKDINPSNILINPNTGQIKLNDFGMASELSVENSELQDLNAIEGTLAYISPEQTGRVNRVVDYRSDYYSLGVTLFELFSGELPFKAKRLREWVHCHIAVMPAELIRVCPVIPKGLNAVVMKLLNKSSDSRYQSGYGILHDLNLCYQQIKSGNHLFQIELGAKDFSGKLMISERLYGRDKEIAQLTQWFDDVCQGSARTVVVKGNAGVGKSKLIKELNPLIAEKEGVLLKGKFDQLKRDVPYYAFVNLLRNFVRNLLSESDFSIELWKAKLEDALDVNARLMIDLIPEIEIIIGKRDLLDANIAPLEIKNRLNLAFQKLIKVLGEELNALVIFIDDLHWADMASLDLIHSIVNSIDSLKLMLLVSFRDDEEETIFIQNKIDKLAENNNSVFQLKLDPLGSADMQQLLCDSFVKSVDQVREFAQFCWNFSGGNPFYLNEILRKFYNQKAIVFSVNEGWQWDLNKIKGNSASEKVADLVIDRLNLISRDERSVLQIASCFGDGFRLSAVAEVIKRPASFVLELLKPAVDNLLIYPLNSDYNLAGYIDNVDVRFRFIHDKLREAAYLSLSLDERRIAHKKIGNYYLLQLNEIELDTQLFEVLGHINFEPLTDGAVFNAEIFELNYRGALRAKKSGAFQTALNFADRATNMLDAASWENNYNQAIDVLTIGAQLSCLCGQFERMDEYLLQLDIYKTTKSHECLLLEIRIEAAVARFQPKMAVELLLKLLALRGIEIPSKVNLPVVLSKLVKTKVLLKKYNDIDILNLPVCEHTDVLEGMKAMSSVVSVLFRTDPLMFTVMVFKQIELTLKFGIAPFSPVSFITYGLLQNGLFSQIDKANNFGALGMKMFDKLQDDKHWAQAFYIHSVGNRPWVERMDAILPDFDRCADFALHRGDFEYMVSAVLAKVNYQAWTGHPMPKLIETIENYIKSFSITNQELIMSQLSVVAEFCRQMHLDAGQPGVLKSEYYDEVSMIAKHRSEKDDTSLAIVYNNKMALAYHYEKWDDLKRWSAISAKMIKGHAGLYTQGVYAFYQCMGWLHQLSLRNPNTVPLLNLKLNRKFRKFATWSKFSEVAFGAKFYMLKGERHRIKKRPRNAIKCFEKAIEISVESGNVADLAIAYELLGKAYWSSGFQEDAKKYLESACKYYKQWGAEAIVRKLFRKYPFLQSESKTLNDGTYSLSQAGSAFHQQFDFETVMEASKLISSEIILERLLEKALSIMLEHAGADKALLLVFSEDENALKIEAEGVVKSGQIVVKVASSKINGENCPVSAVRMAERTKSKLVLHDACTDEVYASDYYVMVNKVKSLLIIPLITQSNLLGLVLFENNLATGVFTENKSEILSVLGTQAAVSIENSILYRTLEQKVEARTKEVVAQKEIIEEKNKDIMESLKYAQRIQQEMLPPVSEIEKYFAHTLVYYKPKDVVSGDFYWCGETNGKLAISAADCTGHGIPGAMTSVLGLSFLNEAIQNNNLKEPHLILNYLRDKIINSKHDLDEFGSRDGMDMSLVLIDLEQKKLQFSGAYNGIVISRKGVDGVELFEYLADRMPVGVSEYNNKSFSLTEIELFSGDTLYLYSDGIVDQFGGGRRKKMKSKRFKQLLAELHDVPFENRFSYVDDFFLSWKGNEEQTDDVVLLGITIP